MSLWTHHRGVARRPYGPNRVCQVTTIHVMSPQTNIHPWMDVVFSLNGSRWSHMDPWTHVRSKPAWQLSSKPQWHVGHASGRWREVPPAIGGPTDLPLGSTDLASGPTTLHCLPTRKTHAKLPQPLISYGSSMVVWSNGGQWRGTQIADVVLEWPYSTSTINRGSYPLSIHGEASLQAPCEE
jgi:hypothetical protein